MPKTQIDQIKSIAIKAQFVAEVEFGIPSKNCKNFGICRIHPIGSTQNLCTCSHSGVFAVITVYSDYAELDFLRHSISPESYSKYFSSGKFLVQEDFEYSEMENERTHFSICKGEYYVVENNSMIKVLFR